MDREAYTKMTPSPPARRNGRFSLRRANRALVLVRRIVADVVAEHSRMLELQEMLELEQRHGPVDYLERVKKVMAVSVKRLRRYLGELDAVGVHIQDCSRGRVDFPARVAGRDVVFCWELGEDAIAYWHPPGAGFAGRKRISELVAPRAVAEAGAP